MKRIVKGLPIDEYMKQWYQNNKEKLRDKRKENYDRYRKENPEKVRETYRKYQKKHIEYYYNKHKEWRKNNPEKVKECCRKYYLKNKDDLLKKMKVNSKEYYQKNKKKILDYEKERMKKDPNFAIKRRLRALLRQSLKRYSNGKIYLSGKYGVNYNKIIDHLKPFPKNISEYHVDHIRPLCTFDLIDPIQIKEAFSPENHQWLLASENMQKGGKWQNQ